MMVTMISAILNSEYQHYDVHHYCRRVEPESGGHVPTGEPGPALKRPPPEHIGGLA